MRLFDEFVRAYSRLETGDLAGPEMTAMRLTAACQSVLPIAGAGISVFTASGIRVPVGASDDDAATAERLQFTAAEGPCFTAHADGLRVTAPEQVIATRWPSYYAGLISRTPFRAVTSSPLGHGLAGVATVDMYFYRSEDLAAVDLRDVDEIIDQLTDTLIDSIPLEPGFTPQWLDSPTAERRNWIFLALGIINLNRELSTQQSLAVLRAHALATDRAVDDTAHDVVTGAISFEDLRLGSSS